MAELPNMTTVRLIRGACCLALVAASSVPFTARAETSLEDVSLRGRVLRPDGTPLANTPVVVEAHDPGGFLEAPSVRRYASTTDKHGRYTFTFEDVKQPGKQTNTDFVFSVAMRSSVDPNQDVEASYELELLDVVHDAPDLALWDPTISIAATAQTYDVSYEPPPASKDSVVVTAANDAFLGAFDHGRIDPRNVEDATVDVTPEATRDERAKGTIYHQRFTASRRAIRGSLVPVSRGRSCIVELRGNTTAPCPGLTDGDLSRVPKLAPIASDVVSATVDLGAITQVSALRVPGCSCRLVTVSTDGTTWSRLGDEEKGQPARFVRVNGFFSDDQPREVSVWTPRSALPIPTVTPVAKTYRPAVVPTARSSPSWPWVVGLGASAMLVALLVSRHRRRRNA